MQPVTLLSDVNHTYGSFGYSALQKALIGGEPRRKTIYFIRDTDGNFQHVVIIDAEGGR